MSERFVCTEDSPWVDDGASWVAHPDAKEVGEQEDGYPGGDIVTYECPWCGKRFRVELPQ